MAVAQRNNWNVCNAEVSSTQPFFSSSWEVQIHAAAVQSAAPVQIPVRDCNSIPAESTGGNLHRCYPLSLTHIIRSISASETLPVLKLIIRSHSHNSSSKFYKWLILIFFGMYF